MGICQKQQPLIKGYSDLEKDDDLIDAAMQMEPDLREKAPGLLAEFQAEHAAQTAGFAYEFKRHGDFLSIFLTRDHNRSDTKWTKTINLGATKQIGLISGRPVDESGEVLWLPTPYYEGGKTTFKLKPDVPHLPKQRDFSWSAACGDYLARFDGNMPPYVTQDFPRPSKDDQIEFVGVNLCVLAPFGLGQPMLDAMLKEIERGAPKGVGIHA